MKFQLRPYAVAALWVTLVAIAAMQSSIAAMQRSIENISYGKAIKDFGDSIRMNPKPFLSYLHMLDIGRQYVPALHDGNCRTSGTGLQRGL